MPHITVKGLPKSDAAKFAEDLKEILLNESGCKREHIKVFYLPVERIDGQDEPAIDVYWLPRPQEICDRVSKSFTEYLQKQGHSFVQITFTEFPGNLFYENGVHY